MDFPVEATVHLNGFPNKSEVRKILTLHGFELTDLPNNRVRVKGWFLKLKAAKALLEQLHDLQSKTETRPSSRSPVSSGAIPKYYNTNDERGRSQSRNKLPYPSPSPAPTALYEASSKTHPVSLEYRYQHRDAFSSGPDQNASFRPGKESFPVDADVFKYAEKLKKKDIDLILQSHNVIMQVSDVTEESSSVTLMGRNARTAASKLQSLLGDLNQSLRTQEVYLKDMDAGGQALWKKIQNDGHICCSVLVSRRYDRLHLIGSSRESYELKQRLLGKSVEHFGRTGRTMDRNSKQRSSSLPPINRRSTDRDKGANAELSPPGAAGYSPTKYQDDKRNRFEPEPERAAAPGFYFGNMSRRRSNSESRKRIQLEQTHNSYKQETEKKVLPNKSPMKTLTHLINVNAADIKQKFKLRSTKKKYK